MSTALFRPRKSRDLHAARGRYPAIGPPDRISTGDVWLFNSGIRAVPARQYPNSPWQNYQLAMTQWSMKIDEAQPAPPRRKSRQHVSWKLATRRYLVVRTTAWANTTMETFW
jgi:hypothetical protein